MNAKLIYMISSRGFIWLSALSLGYVAVLAWWNPQAVMDLVQVKLTNTDAMSSIRGVYGGVGITLVITLLTISLRQMEAALAFLSFFWGSYALSRIITVLVDGTLGNFGTTWLCIEFIFSALALSLYLWCRKVSAAVHTNDKQGLTNFM